MEFFGVVAIGIVIATVILFLEWIYNHALSRKQDEQFRRDEAQRNVREWYEYSVRDTERYRDEVAMLQEQLVEVRYLLAEVCKAAASAQVATEPAALYNDLERLAMECVRGYEECGHQGTPRCIPFPPPFAGGLGSE